MAGLVRVVVGLMFVWTLIAFTETAGIPVLPRATMTVHVAAR